MLKCIKFGGASISSADLFLKAKSVILSDNSFKVVVVSALGKRFDGDEKVTDLLYALCDSIKRGERGDSLWLQIKKRYENINKSLNIRLDLEKEFEIIEQNLKDKELLDVEYVVSRGEYLSAKLMAKFLNYEFIDGKEIIKFKACAFDQKSSYKSIKAIVSDKKAVIAGFYGQDEKGKIRLLFRDGSDFTGAVVAKALNAKLYQIVTDVRGFLSADPKVVENPVKVPNLSYRQIDALTAFSVKVLKRETIFPLIQSKIPLKITDLNCEGTLISEDRLKCSYVTMSARDNLTLIKGRFNKKYGVRMRKLLKRIQKTALFYNESLNSFCALFDDKKLNASNDLAKIPGLYCQKAGALVCVGDEKMIKKGIIGILESQIKIKFVNFTSLGGLLCVVENGQAEKAIKLLHALAYG